MKKRWFVVEWLKSPQQQETHAHVVVVAAVCLFVVVIMETDLVDLNVVFLNNTYWTYLELKFLKRQLELL